MIKRLLVFILLLQSTMPLAFSQTATPLKNLAEATTANATDIFYMVGDPATLNASRKITLANLFAAMTGNKIMGSYASLSAAQTAIGTTTNATLVIFTTTTVSSSTTISPNLELYPTGAGLISVSSGQTLTYYGPTNRWPLRQVKTGSGDLILAGANVQVCPQWWGAKGDAKIVNDASVSGSTLTSATAAFTSAITGMKFDVAGAGAATKLCAEIVSVTDTTHAVLNIPASYSGSSKLVEMDSATIASGSMTVGGTTLTVGSAFFVVGRDEGKLIRIADVGGKNISGTLTYVNSTTATMSVSASVAVSGRRLIYGTDDHAALASWIAALPNGGELYLPKGYYINGSALTLSADNLTFSGSGPHTSVIYSVGPTAGSSGTYYNSFNVSDGVTNLSFKYLGIKGTNWTAWLPASFVADCDGVYISNGAGGAISNISADHCAFNSHWSIGFHNGGSSGTTITGSTSVTNISVLECEAAYNAADGLNPNPISGLIVKGGFLHHNGTAGLEASTSNAQIDTIAYYNFAGGVSVGGYGDPTIGSNVTITGQYRYNGSYGVALGSNMQGCQIVGATLSQNGYVGALLVSDGGATLGKENKIVGCSIYSNATYGVQCDDNNVSIENNRIWDNGISGISQGTALIVNGSNCRILNNILDAPNVDIQIQGANTYLGRDNKFDIRKFTMAGSGTLVSPSARGYKALPSTTATSIIEIRLATLESTSGIIKYRAWLGVGGEVQIRSGVARFSAVNKAGTYTTEIAIINEGASNSTGTLTLTWTITTGSSKIFLRATATTSIFGGVDIEYTIEREDVQQMVIL